MLNRVMAKQSPSFVLPLTVCAVLLPAMLARAEDLQVRASATARERGAAGEPLSSVSGKLAAREVSRSLVKLKPAQCVVAVAIGADALDLDLSLKTAGGVLSDSSTGPVASVRYCAAENAEKAQVQLRSEVAGDYALGVWTVGSAASEPPATKDAPKAAKVVVPLSQLLSDAVKDSAKGLAPMTPPREEDLATGDARERDLPLDAEHCYRFLAVAEAQLTAVDLALSDAAGKQVLAGHGTNGKVVLGADAPFCPTKAARFKLKVSVAGGAGRALWQVFGSPHTAGFPVGGEGDGMAAKRIRASYKSVGENKPAVIAYQDGKLTTAENVEATFEVQPGACYVAVVTGAPSVRSFDLELVDQRGNLVAQALDQGNVAHARVCADLKARWTARARAFRGYGEYGLQVFGGP